MSQKAIAKARAKTGRAYNSTLAAGKPLRRSPWTRSAKYRAKPVHNTETGETFDSKGESVRYAQLKLLERAGEISDLRLHPKIVLVPKRGRAPEISWKVDYSYTEDGRTVYEDFKRPEFVGKSKRRLWDGRDYLLLKLWQHFGPGRLRIVATGGKLIREVHGGEPLMDPARAVSVDPATVRGNKR